MNDGQGNLLPTLPQGVLCCLCVRNSQVGTVTALWQARHSIQLLHCAGPTLFDQMPLKYNYTAVAACDSLEKASYQGQA